MEKGFYSSSSRINTNIDRDVGLWLTSKLEEPWSSEKITAQISQELLTSIKPKFASLEPNIKIGLLFSFLALRRKQITELELYIKDIIQIGREDEDEWVRTVSRLLHSLLSKQSTESNNNQNNFNQIHLDDSQFNETRDSLLKTISSLERPIQFLPLEFKFISTNLLPNPLPEAHRENIHFKLKTKVPHPSQPVVSTLGASSLSITPKEPSTPKKAFYEDQYSSPSTTPTLPPQSPPLTATITSASPPVPRAGRQAINTSSNAMSTLQSVSNNNVSTPNTPTLTSTPSHSTTTTAPSGPSSGPRGNYLAQKKKMMVLDLSEVQALSQQQGKKKKETPSAPTETPTTETTEKDKKEKKKRKKKEGSDETEQASDSDKEKKKRKKKDKEDAEGEEKKAKKKGKKEKEEKPGGTPLIPITSATMNPVKASLLSLGLPLNIPVSTSSQNGQNASAMLSQALFNQPGAAAAKIQPITSSMTIPGVSPSQNGAPAVRTPASIPPPKQAAVAPKPGAANPSPDSLFDQSNVLSSEHKKVILAFLAGNRVNPYPNLGQVVQFLLHQEDKVTPDANKTPYVEQLIFEINYETGTWRKLRRKRMSQAPTPTESSGMPSIAVEPQ